MDFRDKPDEAAFRSEIRSFIERELPDELRKKEIGYGDFDYGEDPGPLATRWREKLRERGWIAPAWPREYGGAGMSIMEQFIFNEELILARAPRNFSLGVGWAGPVIMLYGTDEQKQAHIPKILSGEEVWCQGFSEPGSGSDLASLQTRAVRDGDDYVVNGQKIWTSGAQFSDWIILLARTDPDAPKHKGISYFLVDMKTPGITVRPLVNMANSADFNEVFFDNVRVPKEKLLGEENRGWYIATSTLDLERSSIATTSNLVMWVRDLIEWAKAQSNGITALAHNPKLRYELADRAIEADVARVMSYQVVSMQNAGLIPNKEASVAKLYSSELEQRIARTGTKVLGMYGQLVAGDHAPLSGNLARFSMFSVATTIGGGTSEIQRNVIAMRGLGMPRG
jgi:alkylation response protein AidB-like acyl-CoA dehydrogenase